MELVDPRLGSDFKKEEVMVMINVGILCTNVTSTVRPAMSLVVSMLEGKSSVHEMPVLSSSSSSDKLLSKEIRNMYPHSRETTMTESQTQSISIDGPWTPSSTSTADLYPINVDSKYWVNRD